MADLEQAIENIRKATKGFGTNEKLLIETLVNVPPERLVELQAHYKSSFGKTLQDLIHSETSGDFGKLLVLCCQPDYQNAADLLHHAMKGIGCNVDLLAETLIGRTNNEINNIKMAYQQKYGKNLEEAIKSEVSGEVKKFFVCLLQACRDEGYQFKNIEADVEAFFKAGEGKIGTDETEFIRLLLNRNEQHLYKVFEAYAHKHGHSMEKVIKKEFSGKIEKILLEVVQSIHDRPAYFARLLESSMAGLGTDEDKLSRILARFRRHPLLPYIKEAYLKIYGKSLDHRIKGEVSGDYLKLCLAIVM